MPYFEIGADLRVAYEKFQGHLPQRPPSLLKDSHWDFILRCLYTPPIRRPSLSEVQDRIAAFQSECQHPIVAGR